MLKTQYKNLQELIPEGGERKWGNGVRGYFGVCKVCYMYHQDLGARM